MWTAWRRQSSRAPAIPSCAGSLARRARQAAVSLFDPRVFAQAFVDLYQHVQPADGGLAMSFEALASPAIEQTHTTRAPWGFPEVFVISQTALPALLYLPGTQPFRLPIRISAFAISLAALAWWLIESTTQHVRPRGRRAGWPR